MTQDNTSKAADEPQNKAENYYDQAVSKFDMGDFDEAISLMRTALSLAPQNLKYHYNLGFLYTQKKMPEVAINHYKLFLKYAPKDNPDIIDVQNRTRYLENQIRQKFSK